LETGAKDFVFLKHIISSLKNHIRKEVIKMAKNTKQTSAKVASKAGKILRDGRYGKNAKSVAGSALSQAKPKKK
jgi:hypothetical protein